MVVVSLEIYFENFNGEEKNTFLWKSKVSIKEKGDRRKHHRRTRLNGIISPPYPEVRLDNFGFPVGGCSAGRFSVSGPEFGNFETRALP